MYGFWHKNLPHYPTDRTIVHIINLLFLWQSIQRIHCSKHDVTIILYNVQVIEYFIFYDRNFYRNKIVKSSAIGSFDLEFH